MPKKILFIVPYPENVAPSQRLKFEQYYSCIREEGFTVIHSSFVTKKFWKIIYRKGYFLQKLFYVLGGYMIRIRDLFRLHKYDLVYVHLWVTPFGHPVFEWLFRKLAKAIVYDIDDLVYLAEAKSKANSFTAFLKGRKKPIYLMKHADHVITCTPYLDQFVRKYNKQTTDISSTINTTIYRPRKNYDLQNGILVLGWSGSHSTSPYLQLLRPVFQRLKEERVAFRLLVMGDPSFSLDGIDVTALPWKEEYEVQVIGSFDIGLYPLPDQEWVLGKSGLKALQYMAAGVPTIATAIGSNFRIIDNGVNGYLVHSLEEWYQRIIELASDRDLRIRIGANASASVEEHYSVNKNKGRYLSIIQNAMEAGSKIF